MEKQNLVVVGLGNPEEKFNNSPHNVGYHTIDHFAKLLGLQPVSSGTGFFLEGVKEKIWLMKPGSYMNTSGRSIKDFLAYRKLESNSLLIVYDDFALPLGRLRFRAQGSHGGHNGIKSIIERLGTQKFDRLKIGVENEDEHDDMLNYVIKPLKGQALEDFEFSIVEAAEAIKVWIHYGLEEAAQQYNGKDKEDNTDRNQDVL